jgi:hypothetical protein
MAENSGIQNLKVIIGSLVRSTFSKLPVTFFGDQHFERGFSFNIVTKNDPWLLECISSIIPYANEIIVIDSSDDNKYVAYNKKIVEMVSENTKIEYFLEDIRVTQARRKAKNNSGKEIIVHWDADMIAFDKGIGSFSEIMAAISPGNMKKYVEFPLLTPCTDLGKVATKPIDIEPWIFSNTVKELYKPRPSDKNSEEMVEGFTPPKYYKRISLDFFGAVHMRRLMPPEKAYYKKYQGYLLNEKFMEKYKDYNNLKETFHAAIPEENPICVDHDDKLHGPYPLELERFVNLPHDELLSKKLNEIETLTIPPEISEKINVGHL